MAFLYAILCIITCTTKHRRTFYLHESNNCSPSRHIYSLGQSCMRDIIGELLIQTQIATMHFLIQHFVHILILVPPNTHCSLFPMNHFNIYTVVYLTQLENFRSYVGVHHIERLLYYRRHSLCGLELN